MIRALIFDFDGLILDTETPDVLAWQKIYAEYGLIFPIESWGQIIGGAGSSQFSAAIHLQGLIGRPLDAEALQQQQSKISHALVDQQPVLPGVLDSLKAARRLNLRLAIASSSPHSWVDAHLARLGLLHWFDKIICADDVRPGRTKPNPDLFLLALEQLQISARQAIVFEDSPNGVKAARSAGIYVVAVPNPTTSLLAFDGENLRFKSLSNVSLTDLLRRIERE
jgi:HAD superfamily hydrolase (TIGR01509 family)